MTDSEINKETQEKIISDIKILINIINNIESSYDEVSLIAYGQEHYDIECFNDILHILHQVLKNRRNDLCKLRGE